MRRGEGFDDITSGVCRWGKDVNLPHLQTTGLGNGEVVGFSLFSRS